MTTQTTTQTEGLNHVLATLRAEIARYEACTDDDQILAWKHLGLGVKWNDGKPSVCGLLDASPIRGFLKGSIKNGKGEQAKMTTRQVAIQTYLPLLRDSVAKFEAALAAAQ